ncbi:MAG: SCO family protein [Chitinophagales bacterium]
MKSEKLRIFALLLVIATPVFFFLVFRPLSKIPRPPAPKHYYPLGADTVRIIEEDWGMIKSIGALFTGKKPKKIAEIDSVYHQIPNATFQTQAGSNFELDSLRGMVYVTDFFFASCPGICPVMTKQLERVQNAFIKDQNFRLVSISVDPDRDSVPALREYAKNHNAISGRWLFLRAPKAITYPIARDGFYLVAKEDQDDGPEAFIHSEKLTLVDYNGVIRGYYNGTDSADVNRLMREVVLVLRETEKNYSFRKDPKRRGGLGKN